MMLADPGRIHAEPIGVQRLFGDVGDELVRRPRVVLVVIVAQGEVAEFHDVPPGSSPAVSRRVFAFVGRHYRCRCNFCKCNWSPWAAAPNADGMMPQHGRDPPLTSRERAHKSGGRRLCRNSPFVPRPSSFDFSEYLPYLINRDGWLLVVDFGLNTLARYRLSIAMWRILAVLSNDGGQRQIDLAGKTSIDVSTLSRVVTRLVKMGLVTRTRSATKRREVVVRLTAKGVAVLAEAIPKAIACERMAIAGVLAKDLAVVRRSLRRMYQNLAGSPHASDPLTAFELSGVSSRRRPGAARTRR